MKYHRLPEKKKWLKKVLIILFWLCVWQLASYLIHNKILLVGPWQAFAALLGNMIRPDFWKIVMFSLCRIGLGFFLALFSGFLLGAFSYRYPILEEFFSPVMAALKSIPVASFVVLLLIWFGSASLSFFISFLIVFPNVYVNTIAGFKSTDRQLLEMAKVFHIRGWKRFFYLYRPAFMPYLISCLQISLGMSWKSGVAAEVIGMPKYSLGERLYISKIYLDTAGLFAWTLLVILLSFLFEKAVLYLVKSFGDWKPFVKYDMDAGLSAKSCSGVQVAPAVCIRKISKAYDGQQVLKDFSFTMEAGGHYCLMAPSGSGKTTLLRLLGRIEKPDSGSIEGVPERIGMVFQEDRLCEGYDLITNVMLSVPCIKNEKKKGRHRQAAREADRIRQEALRILPGDCLDKPVYELSGGMRRRCAILRAMLSGADILIMDEPFNGLDESARRATADYILDNLNGRTLLVTTHREEDIALLDGQRMNL